ncbi:MAG: sugar phosphate isomerase/epimerase [Candidatus Acetothermia bacterium]|jgi:sugar phosphate isomerase/epimerase|nr:sugar phosphate isomerase/epimerase [Candidatus Acetothermia bacterium]MDH7505278.1 TIM barrel protein [Candidatus Acetothermia bacterium]
MERPSFGTSIFIAGEEEQLWDEEVHQARAAGAEHLAVHLEYPPGNGRLRERQIRRLRNAAKGTKLLVEAPSSWPSLVTPHEGLLRLSLQELTDSLSVAAKLGAALFILRGGPNPFPHLRELGDGVARFAEGVRELLARSRQFGLPLAVENLARGFPSTAEELEGALALGLKLSLALDELGGSGEEVNALLKRFSARAVRVALGPLTSPLAAEVRDCRFAGFLTLEFPPNPARWGEVQESLRSLRELWAGA